MIKVEKKVCEDRKSKNKGRSLFKEKMLSLPWYLGFNGIESTSSNCDRCHKMGLGFILILLHWNSNT